MSRARYIWQDGDWVTTDKYRSRRLIFDRSAMVVGDISDYRSTITGEMITSRSQHREHLKDHDCFEVGNEKLTPQQRSPAAMPSVAEDIKRAIEQPLPEAVTRGKDIGLGAIERVHNG